MSSRRNLGKNGAVDERRELVFKEEGQEYALVLQMLRNGRCEALFSDGTKRLCDILGALRREGRVASGDTILVGVREYQGGQAEEVILKYQPDEARLLKAHGELPESWHLNEGVAGGMDD